MPDHDQRLKELIREMLAELVELALPDWVARCDLPRAEWLQQEVFSDPPAGERRVADLVARVPLHEALEDGSRELLLNIEIGAEDKATRLRRQVCDHYFMLRQRHGVAVLPLAVYLYVGLEGRGRDVYRETWGGVEVLEVRFPYLGLPGLEARAHVEGANLLGVALSVLMRVAEADTPWLKARAMQRIAAAELTAYRRFLLMECVEAYLPLHGPHLSEFQSLLITEGYNMVRVLGKTTYETGYEKGMQDAQASFEKGQRELLRLILEDRFGPLVEPAKGRFEALPADKLRDLARALLHAKSLADLGLE